MFPARVVAANYRVEFHLFQCAAMPQRSVGRLKGSLA
ncbi:hypothetical protein X772_14815 [Mesorhizobium sp. LSJC280B00]|nr:hypothetical protein X772_14815 [Mesorhizobium sp. LSJC280B00]